MTNAAHPFPKLREASLKGGGIYLGNAYWREVEAVHANAVQALAGQCAHLGIHLWSFPIINDGLLVRARNRAAAGFLESPADILVTIDADIEFDPMQLLRMCEATFEHSLVGGAYVKRNGHFPELAIRLFRTQGDEITWAEGQPLHAVEYLATGFMAVHRRVFEKVRDEWEGGLELQHQSTLKFYAFYDLISAVKDKGERFRLSEDWAFCQRAQDVGFTCWVDPQVRLRHWGLYDFTLEDIVRVARPEPGIIAMRIEDNKERWGYAPQPWVVKTSDGFLIYLMRGDGMISKAIAETGEWEPSVAAALRKHLKPGTRFLDVGANLGYFSLLGASLGADVKAIEPNPVCIELLEQSQRENGFSFTVVRCGVSAAEGKFTLVTQGLQNQGEAYLGVLRPELGPTVEAFPLRDLLLPDWRPEVIKLDIEGEEWNAVMGSPEIFAQAKVVIFEVSEAQLLRNSQVAAEDLIDWFREHGFETHCLERHPAYADWIAIKK